MTEDEFRKQDTRQRHPMDGLREIEDKDKIKRIEKGEIKMIEKTITLQVSPEDIGYHFARADSEEQASILYWIAAELEHVHSKEYNPYARNFCFQADAISREDAINSFPQKRDYLISVLGDLMEHIEAGKYE